LAGSKETNTSGVDLAASAIATLAARSVSTRAAVMKAGAIRHLVNLLGGGESIQDGSAAERAATTLWLLTGDAETLDDIADAGGIRPLVAMLSGTQSPSAQTSAAGTLWRLAAHGESVDQIIASGGIQHLSALLEAAGPDAQHHASAALVALAPDHPKALLSSGTVSALVRSFPRLQVAESQEYALAVLSELVRGGDQTDTEAGASAVVDAGAIRILVLVLSSDVFSEVARRHAVGLLSALAQGPSAATVSPPEPIQGVTSAGVAGVARRKQLILDAAPDALTPLIGLLDAEAPLVVQIDAVTTLCSLAQEPGGRKRILDSRGLEALEALLARQRGLAMSPRRRSGGVDGLIERATEAIRLLTLEL
jgi:hypothetical protein